MKKFLALSLSDVVFIMLINVKMRTIVGILTFTSMINVVLSWVEHGKSFITSRAGSLASITQVTHVSYKNSNIQGRSPYVL